LLSNRSQEEHILTKICWVLVFVSESKLYQYRGSNSSSSYQLCKKITVSKHFTQHTLYSPDTSFKNMTMCANELACSSSCQRIRERNTPPCFLSLFLCKSVLSHCHSLFMSNIIHVINPQMQNCHHTLFSKSNDGHIPDLTNPINPRFQHRRENRKCSVS